MKKKKTPDNSKRDQRRVDIQVVARTVFRKPIQNK